MLSFDLRFHIWLFEDQIRHNHLSQQYLITPKPSNQLNDCPGGGGGGEQPDSLPPSSSEAESSGLPALRAAAVAAKAAAAFGGAGGGGGEDEAKELPAPDSAEGTKEAFNK